MSHDPLCRYWPGLHLHVLLINIEDEDSWNKVYNYICPLFLKINYCYIGLRTFVARVMKLRNLAVVRVKTEEVLSDEGLLLCACWKLQIFLKL